MIKGKSKFEFQKFNIQGNASICFNKQKYEKDEAISKGKQELSAKDVTVSEGFVINEMRTENGERRTDWRYYEEDAPRRCLVWVISSNKTKKSIFNKFKKKH